MPSILLNGPTEMSSYYTELGDDEAVEPGEGAESADALDGAPDFQAKTGSAYLSNEELLLWLQGKSDEQYGKVRELMDVSGERSDLIKELTHLKSLVDGGASPDEIGAELGRLQEAYAGTPYADDLAQLSGSLPNAPPAPEVDMGELEGTPLGDLGEELMEGSLERVGALARGSTEALSQDIQGLADALGREDQLTLIQIQEVMSNIRQTSELTSNVLSNRSQTANTIVGNIR